MNEIEAGIPTLHSRAEAWECDFNGHWNTRYYCRSFQTAGAVAVALNGRTLPDTELACGRHLRFHSEMHGGDAITIRSFDILDAVDAPLAAHYMFRRGKIVATALDRGLPRNGRLSSLPASEAVQALPRSLVGRVREVWVPDSARDFICELGPAKAEELHRDGNMQFWSCVARMSAASHNFDIDIGFTLELLKESGIGRMLVELRYTPLGACSEGDFLRVASRMTASKGKAYTTAHFLYTHRGAPVAMLELCTLAVDMKTRRAMDLPNFVTAHLP